jgi:hypothetical protein
MFLPVDQLTLFPDLWPALTDDEIAAVMRSALCRRGRLSRTADLYLAGQCAEHLVDELRIAGLDVVRRPVRRLHE